MAYTPQEVMEYVNENHVKFICLAFCDIFGTQKNISIMPDELYDAFSNGVSFDASSIAGFTGVENSDLLLFPDPNTLCTLPWKSQFDRVIRLFCDIKTPDGTPFIGDSRLLLKEAEQRAKDMGYRCRFGPECEFYLFKTDEDNEPTDIPYDRGSYLDIAPLDKCENIRREICICLEEMGIHPETSHHEQGPGQNEIDFRYNSPLTAADNMIAFKSVVKAIAARSGLFASFMPKPMYEESGCGFHVNISLMQGETNLFASVLEEGSVASHFMAGILAKIADITAIANPLTNSYARLGKFEAPKTISWSPQNRSQLIRIPAANENGARMELRSPDPASNPYLLFALILHAGLDGIESNMLLPPSMSANMYHAESAKEVAFLPSHLKEALDQMENSEFIKRYLPESVRQKYIALKRAEWEKSKTYTDRQLYFAVQ